MVIKELSLSTMEDWFDYFDNRAFAEHEEWNTCYCTAFYYPKLDAYNGQTNKRRDYAKWLIENERMKGYLAYEDDKVIGWVNVNDKGFYPRLNEIKNDKIKCYQLFVYSAKRK